MPLKGDVVWAWDSLKRAVFELPKCFGIGTESLRIPAFLVGPHNSSGVTHLAAKLLDMNRAIVVGEPTGGSAEGATAGTLFFLTLPNSGVVIRVPVLRQFMNIASFEAGMGVSPHHSIGPSLRERMAGRDTVMEHAIAIALGAAPPPRPEILTP